MLTSDEIFKKINDHMIKGIVFHAEMADYFDFLNLHGFKRLHEYRYLKESCEMRGLHRYYVNHFEKLLPESSGDMPAVIPKGWIGYIRSDVGSDAKKDYVKQAFETWYNWELSTKDIMEVAYTELCEIGEIAAACKIKELLMDADQCAKKASRMKLKLQSINYDMPTIALMQDDIHKKYKEKEEKIGVDIC